MQALPIQSHPDLLVGMETSDDAGVYRLTPEIALIQTVDFFTPVVNDPYTFGQIAAANALSDVYAMGGRPLTALNIVCYPSKTVPQEVLLAILTGGLDKIHEAGALLVGGHSVDDTELKYGLAVTGVVHPDKVLTNGGARVGDTLILTKPLGTGVIATAMKGRLASPEAEAAAIEVMTALNRLPAACLETATLHAVTDITGFGLLGHALEMATSQSRRDHLLGPSGAGAGRGPGICRHGAGAGRQFRQPQVLRPTPAWWRRASIPCWLTCSVTPRPTAACSWPWPRTRLRLFWTA